MERMRKTVLYLTSFLLLGCLGWVFFHALCTIPQAKNILKNRTVFPLILAGSIFLLLLFVKLADWCRSWKKHTLMKATAIVFLLILVLQFLYLYYVRYWVGYDNLLVLDEAWYMQTDGHISPDFYDSYFQRYPHNHPVTILLYWVLKIAGKLGVSGLYWPSHLLGLVSIDLALLFMWKLACETEDIHRGFLVAVLSLLYMDSVALYNCMPASVSECGNLFRMEDVESGEFTKSDNLCGMYGDFYCGRNENPDNRGNPSDCVSDHGSLCERLESVQTGCMSDSFSGDMWSDLGRDRHASKSLCRF